MFKKAFRNFTAKPGATISTSFFVFIVIGAFMLMLPAATVDRNGTSLVDALFTSTSALCVTGLVNLSAMIYFIFHTVSAIKCWKLFLLAF